MYLSENIRYLRKSVGLSQKDLSEKLDLTYTQVSAYERGKSLPPVEKIIVMSELFDTNIEDLILKDLSQEKARPAGTLPKNEQEEDEMLKKMNDLLMKRVMQMEEELKKMNPERARELGIE